MVPWQADARPSNPMPGHPVPVHLERQIPATKQWRYEMLEDERRA